MSTEEAVAMDTATEATEEAVVADEYLGMSDEDFLNTPVPEYSDEAQNSEEADLAEEEGDSVSESEEDEGSTEPQGESADEDSEGRDTEEDLDSDEEKEDKQEEAIDYKAMYEQLTAPFKANGKEMKVDNVEDAIRLMQMGANYNRKMAAMKPSLKILKTLENNQLLDEKKLGFLIDLDKRDPKAIAQLLKQADIDPMDLDLEQAEDYKAKTYTADDAEIELDSVLEDIKDSETYHKTLDVVGNRWDASSKQIVAETPQLLKVINDHMASGVYDLISTEVEKARMLGRLDGKSDIEAYREVGEMLNSKGAFDHLANPKGTKPMTTNTQSNKKATTQDASVRRDKRRAASPTKSTAKADTSDQDFNPLNMSDDEFAKQFDPRLM